MARNKRNIGKIATKVMIIILAGMMLVSALASIIYYFALNK